MSFFSELLMHFDVAQVPGDMCVSSRIMVTST